QRRSLPAHVHYGDAPVNPPDARPPPGAAAGCNSSRATPSFRYSREEMQAQGRVVLGERKKPFLSEYPFGITIPLFHPD
ncbi:MAG TPA: hypothetical protein VJX67_26895, partial [Blastocatellia bacterium]|nr:hypothetical protein [Blastocatellia bacterium]